METSRRLENANVLRFLPLPPGRNIELDMLTLVEGLVAAALNVRVVDEDILALLSRNESEALLGVEELHGTRCQCTLFSIGDPHARNRRHPRPSAAPPLTVPVCRVEAR